MYLELYLHMQIFHVVFPRDQYWDPFYFCYMSIICPVLSVRNVCCMQMTAILVADKCLYNNETVLQNELEIVSEWLVDNKLSLHLGKRNLYCLDLDLGLRTISFYNYLQRYRY